VVSLQLTATIRLSECHVFSFFSLWRYNPNSGLGLSPRNFPFHFSLLDLRQSVGLLGRVISSSQGLYLYTNTEKRTHIHKHQTSMPWVGFEPMILASERAKTVHALDHWATVIGTFLRYSPERQILKATSRSCDTVVFLSVSRHVGARIAQSV
jgi:hypothetical protein